MQKNFMRFSWDFRQPGMFFVRILDFCRNNFVRIKMDKIAGNDLVRLKDVASASSTVI